jgi:hypothetical protein
MFTITYFINYFLSYFLPSVKKDLDIQLNINKQLLIDNPELNLIDHSILLDDSYQIIR